MLNSSSRDHRNGGTPDTYVLMPDKEALEWLIAQNQDEAIQEHFGELEDEPTPPGRPEIGNVVNVRLGDLLPDVEAFAAGQGLTRAAAVRSLISAGLDSLGPK